MSMDLGPDTGPDFGPDLNPPSSNAPVNGGLVCIPSIQLYPPVSGITGTLTLKLPQNVQGFWLIQEQNETATSDYTGTITFPAFPQGAQVTLCVQEAGLIDQLYTLPASATFEL